MVFRVPITVACLAWAGFSTAIDTITRDVVIIGGGSSGTYAAIKLKDANVSVAVVDKSNRLGGHTVTWDDPVSGAAVDYGVIVLGNSPTTQDYLARLGLTTVTGNVSFTNVSFFDFKSGEHNPYYVEHNPSDALERYFDQLENYPFLNLTYDLTADIPADLLIPFGDFMKMYELGDASRAIYQWSQGFGQILEVPALYILKLFSARVVNGLRGAGFLIPSNRNMSSIYAKATDILGDDVLFRTTVVTAQRSEVDSEGYISLNVQHGGTSVIRANRIIVSIPPLTDVGYLGTFDLDSAETDVFKRFKYFECWAGVVREPAIPAGLNIDNVSPGNMTIPYFFADLPADYLFRASPAPACYVTAYGLPEGQSKTEDEVRGEIEATMQRLRDAGAYNTTTTDPYEIVALANHSPYGLHMEVDDVKPGYYQKMYNLQGHLNTYWTGAAWVSHDSAALWEYTAEVVANVTKSLQKA
ncbi:Uu.00g012130.m01.CDS01 [Anthostomella pinea]|uniref:Uu.00g012130.m01.CDS01 n=1 Tax=Anthostomella pinea TaxID=933095 RepID=A0AAI8VYK1_9PEZI|nr:Uu.00g012130.m01.CDS01 [Anthostomella pinea]